mmetsp:Transcript_105919/g.178931  ORF Transcript_105919/g.178931 Transcript_105919/m.178931 type:complete len:314 (-) Transcript_105919:687-1628(-)
MLNSHRPPSPPTTIHHQSPLVDHNGPFTPTAVGELAFRTCTLQAPRFTAQPDAPTTPGASTGPSVVVIVLQIQVLWDGPMTKLIEQHLTSAVGVHLLKLSRKVCALHAPSLELLCMGQELGLVDPPVVVVIHSVEHDEQFKIQPQVLEQNTELRFCHEIRPEPCFAVLVGVLGRLERPHDGRFAIENLLQLQDVPQAFVRLGQRNVPVAVDIDQAEQLLAPLLLHFTSAVWQALGNQRPVDCSGASSAKRGLSGALHGPPTLHHATSAGLTPCHGSCLQFVCSITRLSCKLLPDHVISEIPEMHFAGALCVKL